MRNSEKDRLATAVAAQWLNFQEALSNNRRKYPTREFHEFAQAVRRYVDLTRRDRLVHRTVAEAINGLTESLLEMELQFFVEIGGGLLAVQQLVEINP